MPKVLRLLVDVGLLVPVVFGQDAVDVRAAEPTNHVLGLDAEFTSDDECLSSSECALHALQLRAASSTEFSQKLEHVASQLPQGPTRKLLQAFKVCSSCNSYKRLGEAHDGGYLTCLDDLTGHVKAAYSMGVEKHDKWSDDVYNLLKVPVYQFDCTVSSPAQKCANCHFFPACLKSKDGAGVINKTNYDLGEALAETGQSNASEGSLIMKMDIEGAEWPILADSSVSKELRRFRQLIFEFHWLEKEEKHGQYLKALTNIFAQGFRISHIHGNNFQGMYEKSGFSIPKVIEVTLLSHSPVLPACQTRQAFESLDAPNNPKDLELPAAHLPSSPQRLT